MQKGKMGFIFVIMMMGLGTIIILQSSDEILLKSGRGPKFDFNFDGWGTYGNVTIPTGNPDTIGLIDDIDGEEIHISNRHSEEDVIVNDNTSVFFILRDDEMLMETTKDDLTRDSMIAIWGFKNSNGQWVASDVGILS